MEDFIRLKLEEHDIDLGKENVVFAFHDCTVHVSHNFEDDTLVIEVRLVDTVIGIPLNFMEVTK